MLKAMPLCHSPVTMNFDFALQVTIAGFTRAEFSDVLFLLWGRGACDVYNYKNKNLTVLLGSSYFCSLEVEVGGIGY